MIDFVELRRLQDECEEQRGHKALMELARHVQRAAGRITPSPTTSQRR